MLSKSEVEFGSEFVFLSVDIPLFCPLFFLLLLCCATFLSVLSSPNSSYYYPPGSIMATEWDAQYDVDEGKVMDTLPIGKQFEDHAFAANDMSLYLVLPFALY